MKKLIEFLIVLSFMFNLQFCISQENNTLTLSSVDQEQEFAIEIGEIVIFENRILDTLKINNEVSKYKLNVKDIKKYIKSTDKDNKVFWLTNKKTNEEDEISVYLFGTFNSKLINLYYVEVGQGKWFWKLNNGIINSINNKVYKFSGDLVSMSFALSGFIKFPYNEKGTYSVIERYLNFKTTFIYNKK